MKKEVYQICVSGAAGQVDNRLSYGMSRAVGRQIVEQGHILLSGATKELPYEAAKAAKDAGGVSIGFSPAKSRREHIKKYRLPIDAFDTILYTGFEYTGRNLLLIRSADAVIMVGGRIGTLNEFTIAIEEKKPIGVLVHSGGMTSEIEHILKAAHRGKRNITFDEDPARLVKKVIQEVNRKYRSL